MYVRKPGYAGSARWAVCIGALILGGCGTALGPGDNGGTRPTLNLATLGLDSKSTFYETDANDFLELAELVEISAEPRVIRGRISGNDVDVYNLGSVIPGDRVLITMTTADSLDGAIALFDDTGTSLLVNDHRNVYQGTSEPYVDVVVRRPSDACFVAASATPGYSASGEYALVASNEYPTQIPQGRPDTVLLVFDGGNDVRIGSRTPVDVPVFDAANISPSYAGETAEMQAEIVASVREDYQGYDLEIFSTSEGASFDGEMTRVFFGTFDEALLGVAENVDEFNALTAQHAIIFTDTFGAFMPLEPSPSQMAQAIANVTSHEIGHLLGLVHTSDPSGIMDVTAGLSELLLDQTFNKASLHSAVFPLGYQDAVQSLLDSVGGDVNLLLARPTPSDSSVLRARIDPDEPPARAQFYFSSCGLEGHEP